MDTAFIQKLLRDLQQSACPKAEVSLTVSASQIYTYFRPTGWGGEEPSILGYGDTPEASIADARSKWEEMRERVTAERTKKIALAIIRLTHEQGQCTDAALRAEFDRKEIERYGADALILANKMAENGPFAIIELAGANAA